MVLRANERCQKALKKAGGAFATKKLKILEGCRKDLFACVETKPIGALRDACLTKASTSCTEALTTALAAAEAKFTAKVTGKCAGVDVESGLRSATRGLGYETIEGQCQAEFGIVGLGGLAEVAACVLAEHACRVEEIFAVQAPRMHELLKLGQVPDQVLADLDCLPAFADSGGGVADVETGKVLVKCTRAVARAGARIVSRKQKALERCVDRLFACVQGKHDDPACETKAVALCGTLLEKIIAEGQKAKAAIAKACAGELYTVLRGTLGADLDALQATCDLYGVTDLAAGVERYAECVVRSHECHVAELIQFEAPRAATLLVEAPLPPPAEFPNSFCPAPAPPP